MKFLFSLFLYCCVSAVSAQQQDTTLPAYKRYPTVPGLQLFLADSTKYTNENLPSKKQLLLMLFSPDCDHCQHEAEQIVANREALKDTHIIMTSSYPLARIREFGERYHLTEMNNVVLTKDPYYVLLSFYAVKSLPYLALYDKNRKLIRTYQGSVGIEQLLQSFKDAR